MARPQIKFNVEAYFGPLVSDRERMTVRATLPSGYHGYRQTLVEYDCPDSLVLHSLIFELQKMEKEALAREKDNDHS